ncbi:MAG: GTP-binding protein [Planctomycetes bacterium]|nr:GTP-binding protein [Planctomycetota bacterium]
MHRLRTFGIVAHIDAGKTTLTERILFDTGAQSWVGNVDEGTAAMDWMPAERSRGISITAAATRATWGQHVLQIVDTPGHVDFVAEVERCLQVIDGVVVVVDAVRGVESQTRAVWQQATAAELPRLVFVNKLDRPGADFDAVVRDVAEQFGCHAAALVVPLFDEEGAFAGLGDAVAGAVQWFEGRPSVGLVPQLQQRLLAAHERLVEAVADHDDAVLTEVVAGRRVTPALLRDAVRAALLRGALVPVLGGAALFNRGVDWLLDAVVAFLPGAGGDRARGIWRLPGAGDDAAPFAGFVFKVQHVDRVWNFVRVVRGRLAVGDEVGRGNRAGEVRMVAELCTVRADRHEQVAVAGPGEIVVVPGELGWRTGDTICAPAAPVVLPAPRFPAPVLAVTFEPAVAEQRSALHRAVLDLARDDPTLRVGRDHDRIVVRGMGELHLEVVAELVRQRAGVEFRVSKPRVDRRETVAARGEGQAEVRTMIEGRECAARCRVVVEPRADAAPAAVQVVGEGPLVEAVRSELAARAAAGHRVGPLFGAVLAADQVAGDAAAEVLAEQAASKAFTAAVSAAGVIELEPWVTFEVTAPAASSAAVLADLGMRQAEVDSVAAGSLGARIAGRVALSRMLGYVTRLRSVTKGLGQVTMRLDGFGPASTA